MPMSRHQDNRERRRTNLWEIVNYLWLKYVGISEEYELLKEKWIFLKDAHSPAISIGKASCTFRALDRSILAIGRMFKTFGFEKKSPDEYSNLKEYDYGLCEKIRTELFPLVNYVGLLKLAYFQRTVSHEVLSSTGFAYSPERTVGSEMVYLAADKVAKTYSECIDIKRRQPANQPVFMWDGFITFIPPIQSSGFFGALCSTQLLGLYHVSISEEQKGLIPPLMMLAHEVSHIAIMDPDKGLTGARDEYESVLAYLTLHVRNVLRLMLDDGRLERWAACDVCPLNALAWVYPEGAANNVIQEIIADFFSYKISGPNSMELLLDEGFLMLLTRLRVNCIASYVSRNATGREELGRANNVLFRVDDIDRRARASMRRWLNSHNLALDEPRVDVCPRCLRLTGNVIGIVLKNFEDRFPVILNAFIKSQKVFSISKNEARRIIAALLQEKPLTDVDPRKLLHCYIECFRRTKHAGQKPQYPVVLYSLAFNES